MSGQFNPQEQSALRLGPAHAFGERRFYSLDHQVALAAVALLDLFNMRLKLPGFHVFVDQRLSQRIRMQIGTLFDLFKLGH